MCKEEEVWRWVKKETVMRKNMCEDLYCESMCEKYSYQDDICEED